MPAIDVLGRESFLSQIPASRETLDQLDRYAAILMEWNERFNLVADSTIPQIWTRHFLDSAQLGTHIIPLLDTREKLTVVDMGSGAGFPGIVLAILHPKLDMHLVESTGKKANFLRAVVEELKLNVTIHQKRVEAIRNLQADIVTARAVGALLGLLSMAKPLMSKNSFCLFLKGLGADVELTEARKYWTFTAAKFQSLSDNSGTVLKITDLRILRHHGAKTNKH